MSSENVTLVNENVVNETVVNETSEVKLLLQSLLDDSAKLQSMYKTWNSTLKNLEKEMEREQKKIVKCRPKRQVNQKPQLVSNSMRNFMKKHATNVEASDSYTRQVMMRAVSAYIKEHKLQNSENKKQWAGDKTLKSLFKLDKPFYTFMEINGLISRVVSTK